VPVGIGARVYIPIRHEIRETESEQQPVQNIAKSLIVAFVILVAFRSWAQINMITFLPKYFSDLGYRPGVYGLIAALFMAGSATGGVLGGWLGDRFSKRNIVVISLLTGAIPLFLFPLLSTTSFVYVLTLLAGFFTGIPHSILVIIAQRLLPGKIGMASGIILGFTFASGSLGTLLSGIQADFFGFDAVFLTTASISLIAGLMAIPLDKLSSVSIINT
jgi:FSR family fosmidomycin resistance protein-like MFS transporter